MKKKLSISFIGILSLIGVLELFTFASLVSNDIFQKDFNSKYYVFALNIPDNLNFANEKVPVKDFDIRERMDRELTINTYWQSNTLMLHKRANRWFPTVEAKLKAYNIPDDFKYVLVVESGFQNLVSPAGASGYWQFIESTALQYGLQVNEEVDERYHMEKSTDAACKYFLKAYKEFGNWTLAAASYNIGIEGLKRQLLKQQVTSYYDLLLNEETNRYILRILAVKEILSEPKKYGYNFRKNDLYYPIPVKVITVDSSITDLVAFAKYHDSNYKILKILNPWLRKDKLSNPDSIKYRIKFLKNGTDIPPGLYFDEPHPQPDTLSVPEEKL